MLKAINILLKKSRHRKLTAYFDEQSSFVRTVYNQALYIERQLFTAYGRETLHDNQKRVAENCEKLGFHDAMYLNYYRMEKYFRNYHSEYFHSAMSSQCVQNAIRRACTDMDSYYRALKSSQSHPEKFLSKPEMPSYCKREHKSYFITNQDCKVRENLNLKFPKTKLELNIGKLPEDYVRLKQVEVVPWYDSYKVVIQYESKKEEVKTGKDGRCIGIDLGVNNFAAIAGSEEAIIISGARIKSVNHYFNKQRAQLKSKQAVKDPKNKYYETSWMKRLSRKRQCWMDDYMHKVSRYVINYCTEHNITTIVVGRNRWWKQGVDKGKKNNQNFTCIPHYRFIQMLEYKGRMEGIEVIKQEEAFTSKASFIDRDEFSWSGLTGKRVHRGLYVTRDGTKLNGDINGAANILRKQYSDIEISKETLETLTVIKM